MQKKPGLPPNKVFSGNNKRGRGRGRGAGPAGQFGGTMAPVHSLSKVRGYFNSRQFFFGPFYSIHLMWQTGS